MNEILLQHFDLILEQKLAMSPLSHYCDSDNEISFKRVLRHDNLTIVAPYNVKNARERLVDICEELITEENAKWGQK